MKKIHIILMLLVFLMSCSNETEEMLGRHRKLVLDCAFNGFDSGSRSGESGYGISEGARLYLDFDGMKTYATYNSSNGSWTMNEYPDDSKKSGTVKAYYYSSTDGTTATLDGTGTYSNSSAELRVTASLNPNTARIRFHGDAGKTVKVSGLMYISGFSTSSYSWSIGTDQRTLTIGTDGYTPYVYAPFSNGTSLAIQYDGETYTQNFTSNVLQPGKSGYIDLKSHEIAIIPEFTITDYDSDITLIPSAPSSGTHEAVDLGLSVKWATCNVGANNPEDYGDHYAWGETETKSTYDWSTYKWCQGFSTTMTKYCKYPTYGIVDNKKILDPEDDVAHVKWGGSWRMPTRAEQDELREKCTWTWTTQNDVNGYKVTSKKNGNSIFLPAAGGTYWSSSLDEDVSYCAYCLYFYSDLVNWYGSYRCNGFRVRPVCP